MRLFLIILSIVFFGSFFGQSKPSAEIWFPMRSGLASADFEIYRITGDSLYVLYKPLYFRFALPDSLQPNKTKNIEEPSHLDTLGVYPVSLKMQQQLASILERTDSLGHHSAYGCVFIMGWPRFLIYTEHNDKKMSGYVANCYRKHIFRIVDVFNEIYPEGNILDYEPDELIQKEKDCDLYWEKYLREKNE